MEVSSVVTQQYKNLPLLSYLSQRFTYLSQLEWQERISENRLSVNGSVATAEAIVVQRDIVTYDMPDFIEPYANLDYSIIYENQHFFAVNKPGNLLVHKHGRSFKNNLVYQLREVHKPRYPQADIVNRLDRDTSGIVLISQSKEVLKELQSLFAERKVSKVYWAVVEGVLSKDKGVFTTPIGSLKSTLVRQKQGSASPKVKEAITEYRVLRRSPSRTLLELRPHTGRTHQLRVHCAEAGFPLVGDALYTLSEEDFVAWRNGEQGVYRSDFERQALHCTELSFAWRGEQYHIACPAPKEFEELLS